MDIILVLLWSTALVLSLSSLYTGYKDFSKLGKPIMTIKQGIKTLGNILFLLMLIGVCFIALNGALRIRVLSLTPLFIILVIMIFLLETVIYMLRTPRLYEGGFVHYYAIIPWENLKDYQWKKHVKSDKVTLILKGSFRRGLVKYKNREISLRLSKEGQAQVQKILTEKGITEYCSS